MRQKSGGIQKTDERKEDNRMGFFDKKQCGICGKDAGRLLAYTLKDNKHLCDECFHKIYTGFISKTLTYGFPEKLLPVKDIFDELVM